MTSKTLPPPLSATRRAGDLLFVSGQLPREDDGRMASGGIQAQTHRAIDNLEARLAEHGATLENVVKATVWLTDASLAAAFNEVYRSRFPQPFPTRSTVVSGLLAEDALIEIEAVAFLG